MKLVAGVIAVAIPAIALVVSIALQPDNDLLKDYQRKRILAFINPEEYAMTEAYQQMNSVTAIASGQLDGKGYRNNEITSVKNGNFISNRLYLCGNRGRIRFQGKCDRDCSDDGDSIGMRIGSTEGTGCFRADHCRRNGRPCGRPGILQYRCGSMYHAQHRPSTSLCQLWADFGNEPLYGNGVCTKREAPGQKIQVREGV